MNFKKPYNSISVFLIEITQSDDYVLNGKKNLKHPSLNQSNKKDSILYLVNTTSSLSLQALFQLIKKENVLDFLIT